jgi:hypothetical protein
MSNDPSATWPRPDKVVVRAWTVLHRAASGFELELMGETNLSGEGVWGVKAEGRFAALANEQGW